MLLLLAIGVVCALIAVILDGKAYRQPGQRGRTASQKSIVICVVSGVLMGLWNPFVAYGATRGHALTPYSSVVFLTLGALLSCFIWNLYFMKKPLVGEPVGLGGFFSGPPSGHLLGLLGGMIWGIGTVCNVVAGGSAGFAHVLRDRAIGADGRRAVGRVRVEGICRRGIESKDISGADVCVLRAGDSGAGPRQRLTSDVI